MPEKHLLYFKTIESFNSKECPICHLVKSSVENYFQDLLYENINDSGFREKYNKDSGFCNFHSYQFFNYSDSLAIALTHKVLLNNKLKDFKKNKNQKKNYLSKKSCLICRLAHDAEKRYSEIIYSFINDKELKASFLQADGFCIPHFETFINKFKPIPEWFKDFHYSVFKKILEHLNKYLENCNITSGKSAKLTDEEKDVVPKVVSLLFGFNGMVYDQKRNKHEF